MDADCSTFSCSIAVTAFLSLVSSLLNIESIPVIDIDKFDIKPNLNLKSMKGH